MLATGIFLTLSKPDWPALPRIGTDRVLRTRSVLSMVKVGDDADLVFKVTRGSKVILYKSLAPQCFQCESGLVVDRGKDYLVVASASRVPQAWTVSKNGTVKVVATKFGFKDYYRQVKGNRIVFAKVFSPYSKSYSVLNVKTLEFTNLTASEARSRNLAI